MHPGYFFVANPVLVYFEPPTQRKFSLIGVSVIPVDRRWQGPPVLIFEHLWFPNAIYGTCLCNFTFRIVWLAMSCSSSTSSWVILIKCHCSFFPFCRVPQCECNLSIYKGECGDTHVCAGFCVEYLQRQLEPCILFFHCIDWYLVWRWHCCSEFHP